MSGFGMQIKTSMKYHCTTKETISKVKRQPSDWEKIIANEAMNKRLISKIYKQLLQLNSRKINGKKRYNFPKLDQEKIENMKRQITNMEIKTIKYKSSGPDGFTGEFYQKFKELTHFLLKRVFLPENCRGRKTPELIL